MFANALLLAASLSLATPVSIDRFAAFPFGDPEPQQSEAQQLIHIMSLGRSAVACFASALREDVRYAEGISDKELPKLIEELTLVCVEPMGSMYYAYAKLYGEKEADRYFMGPFLDALPKEVLKLMKARAGP
jgi:hypothetical protein